MASQQGRQQLLALLLLLLGQACVSIPAAASTSREGTILVSYNPLNRQQALDSLNARGYDVVQDLATLGILVAKLRPGPAAAAAAAAGGVTSAAAQAAALESAAGIEAAAFNGMMYLVEPVPGSPLISDAAGTPSSGQQPSAAAAAAAAASAQCAWPDARDVDYTVGIKEEGRSYGMKMVQADTAEMQDIADTFKSKVLYCVMDTGLDVANKEFAGVALSGAVPEDISPVSPRWDQDTVGHGTHVSGVIAAVRNAKGIIGVSPEGANLIHVRVMPDATAYTSTALEGLQQCVTEFDRRKAAAAVPDMKLVISMSLGSPEVPTRILWDEAISRLTVQRSDILLVAAAGNTGTKADYEYPAGNPNVLAVAAVDASGAVASFSTRQKYVAIAGPGVNIVSTIPLALTTTDSYYLNQVLDRVSTTPPIPEVIADPAFLAQPPPEPPAGIIRADVSGPLVSCGLASSVCESAAGKICLIQRGGNTFRDKVKNCMDGGGIGALIYNRDDLPPCQRLDTITVGSIEQQLAGPADRVPTMALARAQGEALLRALQNGTQLTASIRFPVLPAQTDVGLGLMSGTSMATPAVSGVAGLVWSAHTACGAAEIRNALLATAKMPQGATPDGTTYVRGTRNNDVGFGIVQALAAHKYLLARPCKAPPRALQVTVLVRPDGVNGTDAKATALPPDALRTVGQRVTLIVKLRDADGNPVVGQKVRISVQPSPDMVKCGAYERATNVFGAFGVRCAVTKEGRAVLTATVPAGPGVAASKGQSTLNIRRAGQQTKLPR